MNYRFYQLSIPFPTFPDRAILQSTTGLEILMNSDLIEILDNFTSSDALKFLCLFLGQNDQPSPPHIELGFTSQSEAFTEIARRFNSKPRTVQNERDAFDRYTDSPRAGWDKELPPRLAPIFDNFGSMPRDDMRAISQAILKRKWKSSLDNVDAGPVQTPDNFSSAEALKFLCLFLAQNEQPEPPHIELGFKSRREAFSEIADLFKTKPATVKNRRDAFDRHTDSSRVGWEGKLPPGLLTTFENYGGLSREDMRALAQEIIRYKWENNMAELEDLEAIRAQLVERLAEFPVDAELRIDGALWRDIATAYETASNSDRVSVVGNHAMRITSATNCYVYISSQELRQVWACLPYSRALFGYRDACDRLVEELGYSSRKNGTEIFKKLPVKDGRPAIEAELLDRLEAAIDSVFSDPDDRTNLRQFFFDPDWSGLSKTLERNDWVSSAIISNGEWVNVAADRRGELTEALTPDPSFETRLRRVLEAARTGPVVTGAAIERVKGGENLVYYGAPGTGKSFTISKKIEKLDAREVKTVFHPDVQNSDFIGTLKPVVDDGEIGYRFSPGPFLKAYVEAWNNPGEPVWFVIEELNRAPASAVFGELFLLLDRAENGGGEYSVDYPSTECQAWIQSNIAASISDRPDKLKLPSNLTIACTLNSADQGVYPLDTAFRRRWTQHYVPLDYTGGPDKEVTFIDQDGTSRTVHWRIFVKELNDLMERHGIREDRLLGPWFAAAHEFSEDGRIPGKVLVYLWDDLFRNHDKALVFSHAGTSYGGLVGAIDAGKCVLSEDLTNALCGTLDG